MLLIYIDLYRTGKVKVYDYVYDSQIIKTEEHVHEKENKKLSY